jgi:hypothetical protein
MIHETLTKALARSRAAGSAGHAQDVGPMMPAPRGTLRRRTSAFDGRNGRGPGATAKNRPRPFTVQQSLSLVTGVLTFPASTFNCGRGPAGTRRAE